jgi:hypothetical protein
MLVDCKLQPQTKKKYVWLLKKLLILSSNTVNIQKLMLNKIRYIKSVTPSETLYLNFMLSEHFCQNITQFVHYMTMVFASSFYCVLTRNTTAIFEVYTAVKVQVEVFWVVSDA